MPSPIRIRNLSMLVLIVLCITGAGSAWGIDHTTLIVKTFPTADKQGAVFFALFDKEAGFPSDWSKAVRMQRCTPEQGSAQVSFKDLPPGDYAVTLYHDENNNGVVDLNYLGMPVEGWGVSKNIRPSQATPSFSESSIHVRGDTHLMEIKLNY
jgi:uncharacterized protein (DUF2141 family)